MIKIRPHLYIGNQEDAKAWLSFHNVYNAAIVHACKEPYHRELLGYTSFGAPKDHPEYLIARRDNSLFLNLIDAPHASYIPKSIIDAALEFIAEYISQGQDVLVHCNLGESRGPSIGLLYMVKNGEIRGNYEEVAETFKELYPPFNPGSGMREYLKQELDHEN